MKFSGKMCLMIIFKVTKKKQGFTLCLADTIFKIPQGGGGGGGGWVGGGGGGGGTGGWTGGRSGGQTGGLGTHTSSCWASRKAGLLVLC